MTSEKLLKAISINKQIKDLKEIIANGRTQECTWIEFTFGNGSNRKTICNNENTIQLIRDLAVKENQKQLSKLEQEFLNL